MVASHQSHHEFDRPWHRNKSEALQPQLGHSAAACSGQESDRPCAGVGADSTGRPQYVPTRTLDSSGDATVCKYVAAALAAAAVATRRPVVGLVGVDDSADERHRRHLAAEARTSHRVARLAAR
jgi:hypothetical protein